MDKRFWGGAIAVLTVVVAGAGVLPGLLLRPAVEEIAGPVEPVPFVTKPVKLAEPEPVRAAVSVATAGVAEPKEPPKPEPEPQAAPQAPATAPHEAQAARPAAVAPNPISFPPVQPIGIAAGSDIDAPPKSAAQAPIQSRDASARSTREVEKPARSAARDTAKRKRAVRPAIFPIREFLAWRR